MNKASIIKFSDTVREKLLHEVNERAAFYGIRPKDVLPVDSEYSDSIVIGGKVFNKRIKDQREHLVKEVKLKGYEQVMDEVTYSWFNRFVALKFMEVNDYIPVKVFISDGAERIEPEIITNALELDFLDIDYDLVLDMKANNEDEELYKYLILKLCNYLNKTMPFMFEKIEDYTELLFPENLLHIDSIVNDINEIIPQDDWREVEIIGWIYQDYIAPKKDKVFKALQKNVKISKENIPAATQLFTPHWIVRYLVENSLGRLWMLNRPGSRLFEQMDYYIKPEESETDFLKVNSPEDIKVCDPACGSGHMLVYAFDLLYAIYEEEGYDHSEIPKMILTRNLYGIEIDERAGELAAFALTMKARRKNRKFFHNPIQPNICVLKNISFDEGELNAYTSAVGSELFTNYIRTTFPQFNEAENFGSLIRPKAEDVSDIRNFIKSKNLSGSLSLLNTHQKVLQVLKQADYLSPKYHVVVANPPYMSVKGMNASLKDFLQENYADVKSDLFSAFIVRNTEFTLPKGQLGFMSPFVWMFISSYEKLRNFLINKKTITSLVQLEYSGFDGATVPICTFTIENAHHSDFRGGYVRLSDFRGAEIQGPKTLEAIKNPSCGWFFRASSLDFTKIPGAPIAYWISEQVIKAFSQYTILGNINKACTGMRTGDNERFLRYWQEIDRNKVGIGLSKETAVKSSKKWFPYNKGGDFRKWYGNAELFVNWENDGFEIKQLTRQNYPQLGDKLSWKITNEEMYFKSGITWGGLTSSAVSFRWSDYGALFDSNKGAMIFPKQNDSEILLGFLNSSVVHLFLKIFNPTLSTQNKDIDNLPYFIPETSNLGIYKSILSDAKNDWNSYETSWDFTTLPFLQPEYHQPTLSETYNKLRAYWNDKTLEMQRLEDENNRIFIDAYGLQDELTPEVPLSEITLTCNPYYRYNKDRSNEELEALLLTDTIKEFISYAVGCMFGRYSLDKPGLILANQGEKIEDYLEQVPEASFTPDVDNIIPILGDEYFEDDIVDRFKEFLRVTFGEEKLSENLDFIAETLANKSNKSSESAIRDYFLKSFYKDHVKMYKKRPIYWLFSSGKGRAFNALIYMHRYNKETLALMRTDYLLELEGKLDAKREMIKSDIEKDAHEKARLGKLIDEIMEYDELLKNKADEYIEINLDDGVKVNYAKFEGLVEKI